MSLSGDSSYQEDEYVKSVIDLLEPTAAEMNATPGHIALAWMLTKKGIPIIGAQSITHIEESLKALSIKLTADQLTRLENLSAITKGHPYDLLKTVQRIY